MELIVTEKDNAARRIADILSDGGSGVDRRNGVNVYRWGDKRCVGLSGHVVGVDFPPEYSDWRDVEPVELTTAQVVKNPTKENIVRTLQQLAEEASSAVIATDYDREGELIGKEAYELIEEVTDVPIKRVRFSSITENEVKNAFADPDDLDFDLAAAGEARQIIDLMWGAALTRFLSLTAGQLGNDFISVGRVQSPTLKLIVDREREIQAFEPDDYWELFADLDKDSEEFEAQYFYEGEDGTENERVWDESEADAAHERLREATSATVTSVNRRTRTDDPPAPFNTTQYIRAAGSLGYSAQKAMSIAEELYTTGWITYPRTDNTVYPEDLDPEDLLATFADTGAFGEDAASLLELDDIEPTSGDKETTDHPPIHPTGEIPGRQDLSEDEWEIYELVVRRFFATCAEPATWAHLRVVAEANGCQLKANGKRLVEPGYHAVYPYFGTSENYVPEVETGDELAVREVRLEEKQTQPPRRRGQSRLIETMESMGIGTKCLTEDTTVLVRTDDGDVERRQVGELFAADRTLIADGDIDVATTEGPRTVSYDEATDQTCEVNADLISRRRLAPDERVLTVTTDAGSFSVTDDHPLYVVHDVDVSVVPASQVAPGEQLLSARRGPTEASSGETLMTWEEFATTCDWSSKLYGVDCNRALADLRSETGETQAELADRLGTRRHYLSRYETDERDVPVWILGELGIRPEEIHGLNYDTTFENPFPLEWSDTLARVLGNVLGDGSIHRNDAENVVDVRYHNTDERLIERFCDDIETLFGIEPTVTERPGREAHHETKSQVNLPSALGRTLLTVLDAVMDDGHPDVPTPHQPAFIGALFDDEGHVSRERKAFISNTDHDLLAGVAEMLDTLVVETKLAADQHKLHIRGRENLERFLDSVPVSADEKFYRGLDALRAYDVTRHKARILELATERPMRSEDLATDLGLTQGRISVLVRRLRDEGYLRKRIEGSNRSHEGDRTIRYEAVGFHDSVYATVLGYPGTVAVRTVEERDYDGPVFDLSVTDDAPNFAVQGGTVVHNSTRHGTIQKLYDRGYIENDPPRPTGLAMAVVEASERFADRIVDEGMTAQLEHDMDAIASGEKTLDDVTDESREMLQLVFEDLHDHRDEVGEFLKESLKADKTLGPCPECGDDLLVRRSRRGSYFVGCDGFPDCRYTLPLPSQGEPTVIDETCEEHDLKHVKMLAGRSTFVHGCPQCQADEADNTDDEVIGVCPDCGEEHGGELAIKQLRSGSRLVGCTRYPDCDYSLPLPRRGDIEVTETYCEEHDLPELVVRDGEDDDDPWELGCPICNFQEYQERQSASEIEDLDGVGSKTAEKLAAAGIESLDDLTGADADIVADEVQGVSADKVREWQAQAGAS
ncbi:DNA topoisomerase [Halorarius litoreus]|uniref:DNA topoisomerase n=1 Tax=Halorarius litoreus TaxID=2962676 RepID=UPI0020CC5957|nr:DNA topoisomerase [Halorarius litoreus]